MKKIILSVSILLASISLNAQDCIIAKELNVNFLNDSTKYVDEEKEMKKINEFSEFIKETDLYVLIEGHTNNQSSAAYNFDLSQRRAVKVLETLKKTGIDPKHIRAMGFGETTPLYSNQTEQGLKANRRVFAELFNSSEDLDNYITKQKDRRDSIKFKEQ
jgi:outer membrane protein OmpA-like peptidoglycan-associated protein